MHGTKLQAKIDEEPSVGGASQEEARLGIVLVEPLAALLKGLTALTLDRTAAPEVAP